MLSTRGNKKELAERLTAAMRHLNFAKDEEDIEEDQHAMSSESEDESEHIKEGKNGKKIDLESQCV